MELILKIVSALILGFLAVTGAQSTEETYYITGERGMIDSSHYCNCSRCSTSVIWKFLPPPGFQNMIVKFNHFDHQFVFTDVEVTVGKQTSSSKNELNRFFIEELITVTYHSRNCRLRFNLSYFALRLYMKVQHFVLVGSVAQLELVEPKLPAGVDGHCTCGPNDKRCHFGRPRFFTDRFNKSGPVQYRAGCTLLNGTDKISVVENVVNITVQDNLDKLHPSIDGTDICQPILDALQIALHHIFAYPVTYHLWLQTISGDDAVITKLLNYSDATLNSSPRRDIGIVLNITAKQQVQLGPGRHSVALVLENELTELVINQTVCLSEQLILDVPERKYIDLAPGASILIVRLKKGGPAKILVSLRDRKSKRTVQVAAAFCSNRQECREVAILISARQRGVFDLSVVASNSLGSTEKTFGPVESFPLVCEVFVIVPPFMIHGKANISVLFKVANINASLSIEIKANNNVFLGDVLSPGIKSPDRFSSLKIPFDASDFHLYNVDVRLENRFITTGWNEMEAVVTADGKQQMAAKTKALVLGPASTVCLSGITIRDGRSRGFLNQSFNGQARLTISVDVQTKCDLQDGDKISYNWTLYKVNRLSDVPSYFNSMQLPAAIVAMDELVVDTWSMEPGLYLINVWVTHSSKGGELVMAAEDFTSVRIPIGKITPQICGGTKLDIGRDTLQMTFASCTVNPYLTRIKYFWFCSTSKSDLPGQTTVGFFRRKGSCFGWTPSFVSEGEEMTISLTDVKTDDRFFVRLFTTLDGRDLDYSDQEIVISDKQLPNITIECLTNCDSHLQSSESIILHAKCDSCVTYNWSGVADSVSHCDGSEFCRLSLIGFVDVWAKVSVMGSDSSGQNATVSYEREIGRVPSNGCKLAYDTDVAGTSVMLDCKQKEQTFVSFYLKSAQISSLVQYGYSQKLPPISLPDEYVTLTARICSLDGFCRSDVNVVRGPILLGRDLRMLEADLPAAVKSRNTQRVAWIATEMSLLGGLSNDTKELILNYTLTLNPVSFESARMQLDLLRLSIANDSATISLRMEIIFATLSEIQKILLESPGSETYAVSIESSSALLRLITEILESDSSNQMEKRKRLSGMMQDASLTLFDHSLPDDLPRILSFPSMTRIMTRYRKKQNLTVTSDDVSIAVESLGSSEKDLPNMMAFRFRSDKIKFGSGSESPDEVVAVSFSRSRKVRGYAKHSKRSFVPTKPVQYSLKSRHPEPQYVVMERDIYEPQRQGIWCGHAFVVIPRKETSAVKIRMSFKNATTADIMKLDKVEIQFWDLNLFGDYQLFLRETIKGSAFLPNGSFTWIVPSLKGYVHYNFVAEVYSSVNLIFEYLVYAIRCMSWQDSSNGWTDEGCKASRKATMDTWTRCECDLAREVAGRSGTSILSPRFLASKLVVYPNKLHRDFLTLNAKQEFRDNPIVICTAIVVYAIFTVGFVLAFVLDRRDRKTPPYVEVGDNLPADRHRYLVSCFTGGQRSAGPSSTVTIELSGKKGSIVHVLQKKGEKILRRGSVITYLMTSPKSLGAITGVRLWHMNDGSSPEWYLERLSVRDFETDGCWFFPVNTWLSDHHDGKCNVDISLKPAKFEELHSFRSLNSVKTGVFLRDRNIWHSLFAMRPWAVYDMTRVQRVAYCMLFVYMLKLTSLAFFKLTSVPPTVQSGSYSFRLLDAVIGVATCVFILPATYIVSVIFRSCRDRHHQYRRDPRKVPGRFSLGRLRRTVKGRKSIEMTSMPPRGSKVQSQELFGYQTTRFCSRYNVDDHSQEKREAWTDETAYYNFSTNKPRSLDVFTSFLSVVKSSSSEDSDSSDSDTSCNLAQNARLAKKQVTVFSDNSDSPCTSGLKARPAKKKVVVLPNNGFDSSESDTIRTSELKAKSAKKQVSVFSDTAFDSTNTDSFCTSGQKPRPAKKKVAVLPNNGFYSSKSDTLRTSELKARSAKKQVAVFSDTAFRSPNSDSLCTSGQKARSAKKKVVLPNNGFDLSKIDTLCTSELKARSAKKQVTVFSDTAFRSPNSDSFCTSGQKARPAKKKVVVLPNNGFDFSKSDALRTSKLKARSAKKQVSVFSDTAGLFESPNSDSFCTSKLKARPAKKKVVVLPNNGFDLSKSDTFRTSELKARSAKKQVSVFSDTAGLFESPNSDNFCTSRLKARPAKKKFLVLPNDGFDLSKSDTLRTSKLKARFAKKQVSVFSDTVGLFESPNSDSFCTSGQKARPAKKKVVVLPKNGFDLSESDTSRTSELKARSAKKQVTVFADTAGLFDSPNSDSFFTSGQKARPAKKQVTVFSDTSLDSSDSGALCKLALEGWPWKKQVLTDTELDLSGSDTSDMSKLSTRPAERYVTVLRDSKFDLSDSDTDRIPLRKAKPAKKQVNVFPEIKFDSFDSDTSLDKCGLRNNSINPKLFGYLRSPVQSSSSGEEEQEQVHRQQHRGRPSELERHAGKCNKHATRSPAGRRQRSTRTPPFAERNCLRLSDGESYDRINMPFPSAASGHYSAGQNDFPRYPQREYLEVNPASVDNKPMPWFFTSFAWILIVVTVGYSTINSIWYGMTYGYHVSRQWLVSLASGIIASIFVIEPVKAVVLAYLTVLNNPKLDINDWVAPIRNEVRLQAEFSDFSRAQEVAKERSSNPAYHPPNLQRVMKESVDRMKKRLSWMRKKDMSCHVIFVFLLTVMAFGLHDHQVYQIRQPLNSMLNPGQWKDIRLRGHVLEYLDGPFMDAFYRNNVSYFPNGQMLVISPPTVRQQRYEQNPPCVYSDPIHEYLDTCRGSQVKREDTKSYSPGWKKFSTKANGKDSPWAYRSGDPWSVSYQGEHGTYLPGGYEAQLTSDPVRARELIRHLNESRWIDHRTRVVIIDVMLNHVDVGFYCVVSIAFEFSPTGLIHPSLRFNVLQRYKVKSITDYVILASVFLLLVMVLYFMFNVIDSATEFGTRYFANLWNLLEILILTSSIAAIMTYFMKVTSDLNLHNVEAKDRMAFFYAASSSHFALVCLMSFALFCSVLKTIVIMHSHQYFKTTYATVKHMKSDVPGYLTFLFVGFLAFFCSGQILFRATMDFSTVSRATQSIVSYAAGSHASNLLEQHPVLGVSFLVVLFFIFVKVFIRFFAVLAGNSLRELKLLTRDLKKKDIASLRRTQIRSLFAIEAGDRKMQQIEEKATKHQSEKQVLSAWLEVMDDRKELADIARVETDRIIAERELRKQNDNYV